MNLNEAINLISRRDPSILNEHGEVFFSSRNSFNYNNKVMTIGLNPGGEGLPAIQENLVRFWNNKKTENYSGYLDQCWHEPHFSKYEMCDKCKTAYRTSDVIHQDPHQKRVAKIANYLDLNLRECISLNAIWSQTRSANQLIEKTKNESITDLNRLFKIKYFPVIEEIIIRHGIKLVICLGNGKSSSAFSLFQYAFGLNDNNLVTIEGNYLNGKYFILNPNSNSTVIFFGIPHPSRFQLKETGMNILKNLYENISNMQN